MAGYLDAELSENCDERFLAVLNEARSIFANKSRESKELQRENEKLKQKVEQLRSANQDLNSKQESLVEKMRILEENLEKSLKDLEKAREQLANSKNFVKNFFADLFKRMTEIEKDGVYDADTFSYLIGDVGRSLWNTSLAAKHKKSPEKKPSTSKLSTNKEKKRSRYEDISPPRVGEVTRTSSKNDAFENASTDTDKKNNSFENVDVKSRKDDVISDVSTSTLKNGDISGDTNETMKEVKVMKNPSGGKLKRIGAVESEDASERHELVKHVKKCEPLRIIHEGSTTNQNFLDPDQTLRSPIGPPSRTSTPQGQLSGEEAKKFEESNLTVGFQQTSPSLLAGEDMDNLKCTLLPRLLSLEGDIPELSEPQSPTIPSRSHSILRDKESDVALEARKTKRKRSLNVTFGSLLGEPNDSDATRECLKARSEGVKTGLPRSRVLIEVQESTENGKNGKVSLKQTTAGSTVSPDLIVLDDSDFVRPNATSVPRKRTKTCSTNESRPDASSFLLFSPRSKSPVRYPSFCRGDGEPSRTETAEDIENAPTFDGDEPKFAFHLNLDESTVEEKPLKRDEEKSRTYKYTEVVRGKDKRAKLNGYFCSDCEKYYGSLKLSEEEMQERLKACSRHRARFSPPPGTPEHFWDVDFMNTNEYIEKGFLRTESDLPAEKRRLRSRKTRLGLPK